MRKLYLLLFAAVLLTGCKQDDWMDWKLMNELWMRQNLENDDVMEAKSGSGLQYKVVYQGNTTDAKPYIGSTVTMDYTTSLINGRLIDASTDAVFYVSNLVEGLWEGLPMMNVHADYVFYIPWELAYGDSGKGTEGNSTFVPPYSTLIMEVHLSAVSN